MLLSLGGSRAYPWHESAKALPGACGRRAESDHLLVSENDAHSWRGHSGRRALIYQLLVAWRLEASSDLTAPGHLSA